MIDIKIGGESLPVDRAAHQMIEAWHEARTRYEDPDVRIVQCSGGLDVVYDGTCDPPASCRRWRDKHQGCAWPTRRSAIPVSAILSRTGCEFC